MNDRRNHHLLHPCRPSKIILSKQPINLLQDSWRVAKPRAHHMQRKIPLQFGLPAGPPLFKLYRMEQSWPTRDSGAAQQPRHLAA
jgi:hypothetical protein